MSEDLSAYRNDFLVEADETLARLSETFLELERAEEPRPVLDRIYRDMHTLKGMAGMMGYVGPTELSHACEDLLDRIRGGLLLLSSLLVDDLLAALDRLNAMINDIREGGMGDLPRADIITSLALRDQPPATPPPPTAADDDSSKLRFDTRRASSIEATVRVGVDRLDSLLDLVGEVVIARNRMLEVMKGLPGREALVDEIGAFNRLVGDLQKGVLSIRMLPVSGVLSRFPRYLRDLARELGKKIEVDIEGGGTELDRSVLELLKDPLVHILRNAADHGIEFPDERVRAGKDPVGRISIHARADEGSVMMEIADDGRGISRKRVLERAVSSGLVTAEAAQRLNDREVLHLIFAPGLSTAQEVSGLSGRGVGMDVVRASLEELGGHIDINSIEGKGTTLLIKLPLTLAILKALKVRIGDEIYGVPLPSVLETLRIESETIKDVAGRLVVIVREELLPVIDLASAFDLAPTPGRFHYAVVIAFGGRKAVIVVDGLEGQEEIVIKPLGAYLQGGCAGVGGATILGDGRVMLILDIGALLDLKARGEYGMVSRP